MSTRNNIPYRDIIEQFRSACNASLSIATFDTGTIDFLDANAVNKNYPYIYLRPISSPGVVDKVRNIVFELYSLDVPKLSDESPVDVLSETEQRIYELLAWFNQGPAIRQQVYDITITDLSPVNEAFQDRVFGWVATINVATPWVWDYCDYPQLWPTATATALPTATPTSTPTATPTPTVSPTGTPTPTATPLQPTATATPSPTVSPTPTGTPRPTPPPSPTPTPTATPSFYPFQIGSLNYSGSISEPCDVAPAVDTLVYTSWPDEDQSWPDRIVGKEVFSDSSLTQVYTGSAITDETVYRLAFDADSNIYAPIELRWYVGTSRNIVNTAITCSYPVVDTLDDIPQDPDSTLLRGAIDSYGGRNLDQFYFFWGTGSLISDLTNVITASYVDINSEFSASIDNLAYDVDYYYRAAAKDVATDFVYYGDIENFRPVLPHAQLFEIGNPQIRTWDVTGEFGSIPYPQTFSYTGSVYLAEGCTNGQTDPANFVNSYLYTDENLTTKWSETWGININDNDTWVQYQYITGSVTQSGYLQLSDIGVGETALVVERVIPSTDVNGVSINYINGGNNTYVDRYRGPKDATQCTPIQLLPSDFGLPTGSSWGPLWNDGGNLPALSFEVACNRAAQLDPAEATYDYIYMSASYKDTPGQGAADAQSFVFSSPYSDDYNLANVGNSLPSSNYYYAGWSGSAIPSGPADTIFQVEFVNQPSDPTSGYKLWKVIDTFPVGTICT